MAYLNQLLRKKIQKWLSVWQWKICLAFLYLRIGWCLKIFLVPFTVKFIYNRTVSLNVMMVAMVAHLPCIFLYPGFKIWPRYELLCLRFFVYFLNYGKLLLRFYLVQNHITIQSVLCTCSLHPYCRVRHVWPCHVCYISSWVCCNGESFSVLLTVYYADIAWCSNSKAMLLDHLFRFQ